MTREKALDRAYFIIHDLQHEILDNQQIFRRYNDLSKLPLYAVLEIADREGLPIERVIDYVRVQKVCRDEA